ncbi:MAG: hypothetical protein WC586_12775 [Methanoregula sp.]
MKSINFSKLVGLVIGISLILVCSVAATEPGQGSVTLISPNTIGTGIVKENILKFAESSDAIVTYKGTKEFPLGKMYEVATEVGDRYYVNANTGDIEVAMIRNAILAKSMNAKDIGSMKEPVQKFVERNYRSFNTKKMILVDSKIIDHGDAGKEYVFYWNEMSGEAYTLSSVMVSVYPDMDNTITYVGFDRPLLIDTTPKVSQAGAEATVLRSFEMGATAKTTSKLLVVPDGNNQKLVWLVDTVEQDKEGLSHGGSATVDVISGAVISINPVL